MRTRSAGSAVIVLIALYTGCGKANTRSADSTPHAVPVSGGTPHFQLGDEPLNILRSEVANLAIGESRTEITARLGQPNREEFDGPKAKLDWKCRRLTYDVIVVGTLPGNMGDEAVSLAFDRRDRLVQIISTVNGITSRGDSAACR